MIFFNKKSGWTGQNYFQIFCIIIEIIQQNSITKINLLGKTNKVTAVCGSKLKVGTTVYIQQFLQRVL